jgi:hypothetical protein
MNTFHVCFQWLRELYLDEEPIHLIMDFYSLHRAHETRGFAATFGIILNFIPPGCTDELHPLDGNVFEALKSMCRRAFSAFVLTSGMNG